MARDVNLLCHLCKSGLTLFSSWYNNSKNMYTNLDYAELFFFAIAHNQKSSITMETRYVLDGRCSFLGRNAIFSSSIPHTTKSAM
jgi:hypothetical protein